MLGPSDFNNAVPQFTNGDYASNPINPQYIAEPDAENYNRGSEPLQTLPAQWWNWFLNGFTKRFNKVNIYVKNIFNEITQLLSLVSVTPSGTEDSPTVGQLKDMFETKYPDYLKTTPALSNTYVPQTTKVNGHALSGDVTVTCVACAGANGSGTAFGTAATVNTGTAVDCIPTIGAALGTTNGQFIATDATGKLKPSGYTASCFRASTWTPTCVACAGANGSGVAFGSAATCAATAFLAAAGCAVDSKLLTGKAPNALCVACAGKDGSGCAFGTAARYACGCFLSATGCAADSAKLGGTAASSYIQIASGTLGGVCWKRFSSFGSITWAANEVKECDIYAAVCCAAGGDPLTCLTQASSYGEFGIIGFYNYIPRSYGGWNANQVSFQNYRDQSINFSKTCAAVVPNPGAIAFVHR